MNVILVDDEEVAVQALKRRVDWKKHGVDEIYMAYSMIEAQEVFASRHIDIMLSDIEMPQGSGLDLFEWVKTYYPEVECIYITCHPDFEYLRKAMKLGSTDYLLKPIDYEELDTVLDQLIQRIQKPHITSEIASQIIEKLKKDNEKKESSAVEKVQEYVYSHIQETIYIGDIARELFLNEQHLMRIFKKETGVSILEYITNERIKLAKELLVSTEFPIRMVSDAVGYDNYSYFSKIFKRDTGVTPQIFRQIHTT